MVKKYSNLKMIAYKSEVSYELQFDSNHNYYYVLTVNNVDPSILVEFNGETYEPENIVNIPLTYAYSGNKTSQEALEYYKKMHEAAKQEGINLVISSAFRNFQDQKETYEEYERIKGDGIENYAARPGHSEHQTGLAFDILTLGVTTTKFDQTKEFEWLRDNSYKYGFILRYPKDKENITGYDYESWHYRYVGEEAAKKIHDEDITFEEYYAYYIEK